MKTGVTILVSLVAATLLLSCGKTEERPAPAAQEGFTPASFSAPEVSPSGNPADF